MGEEDTGLLPKRWAPMVATLLVSGLTWMNLRFWCFALLVAWNQVTKNAVVLQKKLPQCLAWSCLSGNAILLKHVIMHST